MIGKRQNDYSRYAYLGLVHVDGDVPDTWVHHVGGKGEDKGMRFRYYWLSLDPALELAGGQHVGFDFLRMASLKSAAY